MWDPAGSIPGGGSWNRPLATGFIRLDTDNAWMDQWMGAVDTTHADANRGTVYVLKGMFGWFAGIAQAIDSGATFTLTEGTNGLPAGMTFTDRQVTAIEALLPNEVVFTVDGCFGAPPTGASDGPRRTSPAASASVIWFVTPWNRTTCSPRAARPCTNRAIGIHPEASAEGVAERGAYVSPNVGTVTSDAV